MTHGYTYVVFLFQVQRYCFYATAPARFSCSGIFRKSRGGARARRALLHQRRAPYGRETKSPDIQCIFICTFLCTLFTPAMPHLCMYVDISSGTSSLPSELGRCTTAKFHRARPPPSSARMRNTYIAKGKGRR